MLVMHALDSTLFHIFRLAVWHPETPDFTYDPEFWSMAEQYLNRAKSMGNYTSIVLGLPSSFYKSILCLVRYVRNPTSIDQKTLSELRTELEFWRIGLSGDVTDISSGCEEFLFSEHRPVLLAAYQLGAFVATLMRPAGEGRSVSRWAASEASEEWPW